MASYKVIQDVEAEDKLIGPLTIKQLLYALLATGVVLVGWYVGKNTAWIALAPFIVIALPFIFMAAPLGRDQPNDLWLLSRLNFRLRPKKRLWSQTGNAHKVLVVAGGEEVQAPAGESRTAEEIEARARHLSSILDSHGRVAKTQTPRALHWPLTTMAAWRRNTRKNTWRPTSASTTCSKTITKGAKKALIKRSGKLCAPEATA